MQKIEETLGFQIIQVAKAHRQSAEKALNALGLHAGQEIILLQLWIEEGLTQSCLAEHACVEPPTMTQMLQRMERCGLIERRQDAQDGRISRVYLTERGRALEKPVLQAWQQVEEQTLASLSDVELALLRRLLLQVRTNLSCRSYVDKGL